MSRKKDGTAEVRKHNLQLLVEQWNGPSTLAKKLKYSGPSYISQLLAGHRPITEKTARTVEVTLGLPLGWMDKPRNSVSPTLDAELLASVVAAVMEVLESKSSPASPRQISEIVNLAYAEARRCGSVDLGYIESLISLTTGG